MCLQGKIREDRTGGCYQNGKNPFPTIYALTLHVMSLNQQSSHWQQMTVEVWPGTVGLLDFNCLPWATPHKWHSLHIRLPRCLCGRQIDNCYLTQPPRTCATPHQHVNPVSGRFTQLSLLFPSADWQKSNAQSWHGPACDEWGGDSVQIETSFNTWGNVRKAQVMLFIIINMRNNNNVIVQ